MVDRWMAGRGGGREGGREGGMIKNNFATRGLNYIIYRKYIKIYIWANSLEGGRWSFRLSRGVARAQAIVAAQNGGGLPSRPAFPSSPGTVLTVGG